MKCYFLFQVLFLTCTLALSSSPLVQTENWTLSSEKRVEIASDLAGNRTSWKDWSGETLYTYDHYNYLSSSTSPLGEITLYKHNPSGRLEKITYAS